LLFKLTVESLVPQLLTKPLLGIIAAVFLHHLMAAIIELKFAPLQLKKFVMVAVVIGKAHRSEQQEKQNNQDVFHGLLHSVLLVIG
jgi:hypothetical protein